jgi:hypothetical protein
MEPVLFKFLGKLLELLQIKSCQWMMIRVTNVILRPFTILYSLLKSPLQFGVSRPRGKDAQNRIEGALKFKTIWNVRQDMFGLLS